ncbi:MAG TPA: RNA ligase family protein [Blastocatellia bacterium]|nr:RNA ligase family protein [Blastocatellia bacterium]
MERIYKYPRTHHLEGSRFQPGDEELDCIPFREIAGRFIVVEEKLDGANAGISFASDGRLFLQSRGHFLDGGARERQFALLKTWANIHQQTLWEVLADRYVLYGEWVFAKHTIFYDALPHYFFEFDVLDTRTGAFLSTERRRKMLHGSPLVSVPVLWSGEAKSLDHLQSLVAHSLYKSSDWRERLRTTCEENRQNHELIVQQTDGSDLAEGLYIKVEEHGRVIERYKFVRASFLQAVADSGGHWMDRPILPNQLRTGCDLFGV